MRKQKLSLLISSFVYSLLAIVATTFVACSSDNNGDGEMTNYVQFTADKASIAEDDMDGITVNVLLAKAPATAQTITLSLENNEGDIAQVSPSVLNIAAGQKEASFKILSNNKSSLVSGKVLTLKATFSDANMQVSGEPLQVTFTPAASMPTLTDAQLQLIEGYKEKYGIDLMRIIGKHEVQTTITYNDDDKALYNDNNETRTLKGQTIITLSDYATADTPILKMTSNPMGMHDYLYEMFRKQTVDNNEYFMQSPYSAAAVAASGYDYSKETFSCELDSIVIDPSDMSLHFVGTRANAYDEDITVVPFKFGFTAWDRLKALADEGKEVEVDEGEGNKSMVSLSDIIDMGGSLNPDAYLFNSTISEDAWDNPVNYVTPQGAIDFATGKMSFTFPWDFSVASGYERISVVYAF